MNGWRAAGENKELGKVKISAAGDRLQLQKTIRLSELPLSGIILAVYKSIGSKPQDPLLVVTSVEDLLVMQVFLGGRRLRCMCYSL